MLDCFFRSVNILERKNNIDPTVLLNMYQGQIDPTVLIYMCQGHMAEWKKRLVGVCFRVKSSGGRRFKLIYQ